MNKTIEQIKQHLAGIKEREDEASEGPWKAVACPSKDGDNWPLILPPLPLMQIGLAQAYGERNATFIAASRTDIPSLRAALECAVEELQVIHEIFIAKFGNTQTGASNCLARILTILQP